MEYAGLHGTTRQASNWHIIVLYHQPPVNLEERMGLPCYEMGIILRFTFHT